MDQRSPPFPSSAIGTRDGYDRWAASYDGDGNPLIALETPQVVTMMGDVAGLRVADIGCGTGRHAIRFAAAGATVTAVDFSEGMLAQAHAKPGGERVRWIRHDVGSTLPLESALFDRVLCALLLDHVKNLDLLFGEFARICRPSPHGRIVVSAMHPAMLLKGVQARFTDPATGAKTLVESVPNQIGDYVTAAAGAGLRITRMTEHVGDSALVEAFPRIAPYVGWPVLLMMAMERELL